jgi:DNA-binding CsgD family transcriptional regulator
MPIPQKLVACDIPVVQEDPSINDAIRNLVNITGSNYSDADPGQGDGAEVVMVDAEVDGERYLLVRMPKLGRNCFQLSPREQEIVRMVAKGHPNKVIADVLNISPWTVCTHLRRIFAKMGVASRAAMVAKNSAIGNSLSDARLTDAKPHSGMRQSAEGQSSCSRGVPGRARSGSALTAVL